MKRVIALGFFDGVHVGHGALFRRAAEMARELEATPAAVTFDVPPAKRMGGQPVPLYDQSSNENSRRSLIPVKLNGQYTYLVVVFQGGSTEGRVVGANAGYDANGLPIRSMTKLQEGDRIIPVYTMYVDNGGEDLDEQEFDGDEIIWHEGMTVTYEDLSDENETTDMVFCFLFNDIFGDQNMSEMISFSI